MNNEHSEKCIIDFGIIKGPSTKICESTGKTVINLWENLAKGFGVYWFNVLKETEGKSKENYLIKNLPISQIPLAVYFGFENIDFSHLPEFFSYENSINPMEFLDPRNIFDWSLWAKKKGILRDLVEMVSCSDEKFADVLYQLDQSGFTKDLLEETPSQIFQNSWQSYGRSYIREFNVKIQKFKKVKKNALLLPCTKSRPYYKEKTIYASQDSEEFRNYFNNPDYHKIVISNIGIVPEEFWNDPVAIKYSAGVPDIWRIYKLVDHYFKSIKFHHIVCYVEFSPYIEIVELISMKYGLDIEVKVDKKYRSRGAKFAIDRMYL